MPTPERLLKIISLKEANFNPFLLLAFCPSGFVTPQPAMLHDIEFSLTKRKICRSYFSVLGYFFATESFCHWKITRALFVPLRHTNWSDSVIPVAIDEIFFEHQKSEIVVKLWRIPVWMNFHRIDFSYLHAEKVLQLALSDVSQSTSSKDRQFLPLSSVFQIAFETVSCSQHKAFGEIWKLLIETIQIIKMY